MTGGPGKLPIEKVEGTNVVVANEVGELNVGPQRFASLRSLPERLAERFAGRETELAELHASLQGGGELAVHQERGLSAQGGVGKTALAVEYAWRHLDDYPGGCYFVSAETNQPEAALSELAVPLGIEPLPNVPQTAQLVKTKLEGSDKPSLLIIDNVHNAESWTKWLPHLPGPPCLRLITTRAEHMGQVSMQQLGRLSTEECRQVLGNYRRDALDEANRQAVEDIAEWLDGWAVAVALVGAYMHVTDSATWPDYWQHLQSKQLASLRDIHNTAHPHRGEYDQHVDALLGDLLAVLKPAEVRTLEYAALLPEDQVPASWLRLLIERDGVELETKPGVPDAFAGLLDHLRRLDLLTLREGDGERHSLHRVLGHHLREKLAADAEAFEDRLSHIESVANERANAVHDKAIADAALRWELDPLMAVCAGLLDLGRLKAASISSGVNIPLYQLGRLVDARELNEHAIRLQQQKLDPDDPALAASYSNLAGVLQDLGDLPEARRFMERAISIDEKHFDPDHPSLAIRYLNMFDVLYELGKRDESCQFLDRALTIATKHFDQEHRLVRAIRQRYEALKRK